MVVGRGGFRLPVVMPVPAIQYFVAPLQHARGVLSTLRKPGGGLNPVRQQFPADSCNKSSVAGQYDFREIISRTMMRGVLLPENWFACLRHQLVSERDSCLFFFSKKEKFQHSVRPVLKPSARSDLFIFLMFPVFLPQVSANSNATCFIIQE